MKRLFLAAALIALGLGVAAWTHGNAGGGGSPCNTMTGVYDLTNTCNNIYYLTGVI